MRSLVFATMLVCVPSFVRAEPQACKEDGKCGLTFVSPDPARAHLSANMFQEAVQVQLRKKYPSRVVEPRIFLRVFELKGKPAFSLTWKCQIIPATPETAEYYFNRRGTMLRGRTRDEAERNVNVEVEHSGKVAEMRGLYKRSNIPATFVQDSLTGSDTDGWWYIKEYFLVAPKGALKGSKD